jgi:acyl-CoA synthetase (AMP-forming)/AMP-acid ligase II
VGEGGRLCLDGEAGELWVRGASLMNGYRGRLDDTAAAFTDGWFRTGDIVVREDGYISILGRDSTDIIKSGGFKIGAREIEEILLKDADVLEVAVLGVPDDDLGEKVVAALVLVEGADHSDLLARLQRLSREHLSAYKTLREVKVLPELPRNPMGKLQKFRLREHFSK